MARLTPARSMFGFCMSRIAACVLRLVWATRQSDISVSIAANIFLNAGILIVYILNNVMVQRLLRSTWPHVGWNPVLRVVWKVVLWLVLPFIIMVIVCVPLTFYTLDANTLRICRDVLLVGLTYLFVVACIPLLVLPVVALRSPKDPFGKYGSTHTGKLLVLSATTVLAVIEAGFRTGVQWSPARPQTDPAWYHSKAAFYCFNFTIDILIIYTLLIARFDHHFWVPNQANGHGSYAAGAKEVQREETLAREKKAMEEQV